MVQLPLSPASRRSVVILLLFAGIALRLVHRDEMGSDVLATTREAIAMALDGGNPYGRGYAVSRPPGAPFAYGPVALVWYGLLPRSIELIASAAVLFVLAATERLIGLAVCALWVPLAILANDGSNDSSVGLLLLGTLVLAERAPRLGAAALAIVVAFKPYALAFLPPLLAYGGLGVLVPFAGVSLAAWAPAILLWGADSMLTSLRLATEIHRLPWYSLAANLQAPPSARPVFTFVQLTLGVTAGVASLVFVRSARTMVAWAIVIFAATLFTGWWATIAYWAAVAPIAAWHVDAWYQDLSPGNPLRAILPGQVGRNLERDGAVPAG